MRNRIHVGFDSDKECFIFGVVFAVNFMSQSAVDLKWGLGFGIGFGIIFIGWKV